MPKTSLSSIVRLASSLPNVVRLLLVTGTILVGSVAAQPANDSFQNRSHLPNVLPMTATGHNTNATREASEPSHDQYGTVTATVWWSWTAPETGPVGIHFEGSTFLTSFGIYTGSTLDDLSLLLQGTYLGLPHRFEATAGTTYQIAVGNAPGSRIPRPTNGVVQFTLYGIHPPANDNFANREALTGFPVSVQATNTHATREAGEPNHALSYQDHSVWWSWTAPFTGRIGLMVTKPYSPVAVGVYTGVELTNLVEVAAQFAGLMPLMVEEGVTYQIAADASNENTEGAFTLELIALPPNDRFEDRILVAPGGGWHTGTTAYSTHQDGEPLYAMNGWAGSVWYSWTPTVSGPVWITTAGSSFAADVYMYKGQSIFELEALRNVPPAYGAVFEAQAGETYQMSVTGFHAAGPYRLGVLRAAPNDAFANRTPLSGLSFNVEGWSMLATAESGEPGASGSADSLHSVWWTWTAPVSGTMTISANPGNVTVLDVFVGNSLSQLTNILAGPGLFEAQAGRTYQIRASNREGGGIAAYSGTLSPRLSNDNFSDRALLAGTSLMVTGWTYHASWEPGEPKHVDFNLRLSREQRFGKMKEGRSLWWTWTAPVDGWVRIDPTGSDVDLGIAVYTGDTLRRLKKVAVNLDPFWGVIAGAAEFPATAGVTYQIAVDSRPIGDRRKPVPSEGRFRLSLDLTALRLVQPASGTILPGPTQLNWQLANPHPEVDGEFSDILFHTRTYNQSVVPLSRTGPTLAGSVPELLPGYYLLYARATNLAGLERVSAPSAIAVRPANDDFTNAVVMHGYFPTNTGYISAATWEKGEPKIAGAPPGSGTVWWSWIAPASGEAKVILYGADVLRVWTGDNVRKLKRVKPSRTDDTVFQVKKGTRYFVSGAGFGQTFFNSQGYGTFLSIALRNVQLTAPLDELVGYEPAEVPLGIRTTEPTNEIARVEYFAGTQMIQTVTQPPFSGMWNGAPGGIHSVSAVLVKTTGERLPANSVTVRIRPANDDFTNAIVLVGTNATARGTTAAAAAEPGDTIGAYLGTVWWRWTAPANGRAIIRNAGSSLGLSVNVFTGTQLDNLVSVVDPQGSVQFDGLLTFRAKQGETYYVSASGGGTVGISIDLIPPPVNDDFANRIDVSDSYAPFIASNFAATPEPLEPLHANQSVVRSVWYSWTAPMSGTVRLANALIGANVVLSVYTGDALTNLVRVADIPSPQQGAYFNVVVGRTYAIAVSDAREAAVGAPIYISYEPRPENDDFAAAMRLTSDQYTFYLQGVIYSATRELSEPAHGGAVDGNSVWFSWTPSATGTADLFAVGYYFPARLALYSGTNLANLVPVATGTNTLRAGLNSGQPYRLAIESASDAVGGFTCHIEFLANAPLVAAAKSAIAPVSQELLLTLIHAGPQTRIRVQGEEGRQVALEVSNDLMHWEELGRATLAGGFATFESTTTGTAVRQFYRARTIP